MSPSAVWRWPMWLWVAVCLLGSTFTVHADESLERYFEQLRRRGLFAVAETYAFTRLADPQLDAERRTELVIELARTHADHAAFAGPQQQDEFWQKARSLLTDELAKRPPRAEALRAQLAFVAAVQADVIGREALLLPEEPLLQTAARQAADAAITALEATAKQLEESLRGGKTNPGDLPPHERRNLLQAAQLEMGNVYRLRAALTTKDAEARGNDLSEAEQAYRKSLQGAWEIRKLGRAKLGLAECARLKREFAAAREMLTALTGHDPPMPGELLDAVDACRVRIFLDEDKPLDAGEFLLGLRQARPQLSGELWLLQLQTVLQLRAAAEQQQDKALAEQLRSEAELVLQRVDEHAGGLWSRSCRVLWSREQARMQYGADLDQLVRQARAEYAAGNAAAAASAFQQAAQLARERGQTELFVDLSYTRGSILLESKEFEPAAKELQELVDRAPQHPRAAGAHVLAAYALGRLYDAQKTKARREAYTAALQSHLERFADSPTAGDARFMLARLEEQRLQTSQALPLYLAIPPDHPRGWEATAAAAACFQTVLTRMKQQRLDWPPLQREARETISARLRSLPADPAAWSLLQAECQLALTRLVLHSVPPDYATADGQLETLQRAVATHRGDDAASWQPLAQQVLPLRLLALAGTNRSELARTLLSQLPENEPLRLWAVVQGLDQLSAAQATGHVVELTELCVAAVARLEPLREKLPAGVQWDFDLARVRAGFQSGRVEQGVTVAKLAAQSAGKDLSRHRALATLLQQFPQPDAQKLARNGWKRVESAVIAGSSDWFVARSEVIRCCLALGETKDAVSLLAVTKLLFPESEDEAIRARYVALEKDVTAAAKRR
jgi:TolA-binding protein